MKYTHKSFSVAVSDVVSGGSQMCREKGHSMRDSRGRCLCCGETVEPQFCVLEGGPLDGEVVPTTDVRPSGRTNYIERDGERYFYDLVTPVLFTYRVTNVARSA